MPSDKTKRRVFIPAAVLILSGVSHGLLLTAPLPEEKDSPEAASVSAPEVQSDEMTVVMLPEQKPEPSSQEVNPPEPEQAAPLLQTPVTENISPTDSVDPLPDSTLSPEDSEFFEDETLPFDEEPINENFRADAGETETPPDNYGENFPHFEGAVAGCFGVSDCRRVSSAGSYRSVARSLVDNLEDNGYEVTLRDDLEDTGRNVYELLLPGSNGEIKYLMVFSDSDGSAVYVMSPEIMTFGDLQALQSRDDDRQLS